MDKVTAGGAGVAAGLIIGGLAAYLYARRTCREEADERVRRTAGWCRMQLGSAAREREALERHITNLERDNNRLWDQVQRMQARDGPTGKA